jgi:hypothetical protein
MKTLLPLLLLLMLSGVRLTAQQRPSILQVSPREQTIGDGTGARLALADQLGRTVATPFEGTPDPGEHALTIATDGIAAGAYFLQLSTPSGTEVRPVAIVP